MVGDGDTVARAGTRAVRGAAAAVAAAPLAVAGDEPNTVVTSSSHVRQLDKEYCASLPFATFFTSVTVPIRVHAPIFCRFCAVRWLYGSHHPAYPSGAVEIYKKLIQSLILFAVLTNWATRFKIDITAV